MTLSRRHMLISGLTVVAAGAVPRFAYAAAATPRRLVFVIQRGAADGLAIVAPTGDPAYAAARGALAEDGGGASLNGLFTLHPALAAGADLYRARQAHFAHAVATAYRDRSHFDGQNVLEGGGSRPYEKSDGWVGRLLTLLPPAEREALAIAPAVPLALRGGARVMMIETGGWDTHSGQRGRLTAQLRGLDQLVGALQVGLGAAWNDTLVVVATEFGRTVAVNGTGGTDHGTGSAAMFFGGALAGGGPVAGGMVSADWPGLGAANRLDGRDLKPTRSLESVIGAAIAHHYALDPARVMQTLYPDA